MGPEELALAAQNIAGRFGASFNCIVGEELARQNFPLIHAVGMASTRAPRLIDIGWGDPSHPRVTLVGKGVCFDTGGLDLKPSSGMLIMKKDMGGAANVLALAQMVMDAGLKVWLRVLIPAVENAVSGNAFRPLDVFPSRKGITVEIGNTDAEGRLILADAMAYAVRTYAPKMMIDMATLTGACVVALGEKIAGVFASDETLRAELLAAAGRTQERCWPLPLPEDYKELLKSSFADINNMPSAREGGAISAALFLSEFVGNTPWAHIDIAGPAYQNKESAYCGAGGTGFGVRLLMDWLMHSD
jgi:leucyl aminopeptidase